MTDLPCGSCPWRVGSDARRIPRLDVDRARALDATCPTSDSSLGTPLMACHHSTDGGPSVCVGWALSDASRDSIPSRLAMMSGDVAGWRDLRAAADVAGVEVYGSHAEMFANIRQTVTEGA